MKLKSLFIALTVTAAMLLSACAEQNAEERLASTPTQQAWRLIDDGALLIDVRSQQEFAQGHLKKAVNVPHTQIEKLVKAVGKDKDRKVVVYCKSGRRAEEAKAALKKHGYTHIYNGMGYESLLAEKKAES